VGWRLVEAGGAPQWNASETSGEPAPVFRPLSDLLGLFSKDLGIDLGTANTLVYVRNEGVVISEPSVVAKDLRTGKVFAVGTEAKRMVGRTPATIVAIRPLKDGVISDFDVVESMLRHWIKQVHDRYLFAPAPRVAIGIPSGATEVEWRAVREAALNSGAREAYLIEEPMASAIRRRSAGIRTGRQHGRRHRRRHHRDRRHLARRNRGQPLHPHRRRRD